MNKQQLERIRRENFNKLDTAYRPKVNAMEININNTFEHELAKLLCVWLIRDGFTLGQLQEIVPKWMKNSKLSQQGNLFLGQDFKREWQRPQVVTEARFSKDLTPMYGGPINKRPLYYLDKFGNKLKNKSRRRADIFILDTGEIVEIETGKSYKKGENVITVNI